MELLIRWGLGYLSIKKLKYISLDKVDAEGLGFSEAEAVPAGRRLSLFPPPLNREGEYIIVSSLSAQYIKSGAGHILVGAGVSLDQLVDFLTYKEMYIGLVLPPFRHESIGGLYSTGLLGEPSGGGVIRPLETMNIGDRPIYRDFLIRFGESPSYIVYDFGIESLDGLRSLVGKLGDAIEGVGRLTIYYSHGGYRVRLYVPRRHRKLIIGVLSNIGAEEHSIYDSYIEFVDPAELVGAGFNHILLYRNVPLGYIAADVDEAILLYGDLGSRIYIVLSREDVVKPGYTKYIVVDGGRLRLYY